MDPSLVPEPAALLIPLAGIALPVVIVLAVLHDRQRQRETLCETVKHFADRGIPVPPELLDPPRTRRPPSGRCTNTHRACACNCGV